MTRPEKPTDPSGMSMCIHSAKSSGKGSGMDRVKSETHYDSSQDVTIKVYNRVSSLCNLSGTSPNKQVQKRTRKTVKKMNNLFTFV